MMHNLISLIDKVLVSNSIFSQIFTIKLVRIRILSEVFECSHLGQLLFSIFFNTVYSIIYPCRLFADEIPRFFTGYIHRMIE